MAKKEVKKKKKVIEAPKAEPSPLFFDERSSKSISLVYLGVLSILLGLLATTPIMKPTMFSQTADFFVGMGIFGIVVGLIINNRKKISTLFDANKKNK